MQTILDSSVVIEYLRTKKGVLPSLIALDESGDIELIIPSIVLFELWRGNSMKFASAQRIVEDLLSEFPVISIDAAIAKSAGEIERNGFSKGDDALITACCLSEHAQLATLNAKDFSRVPHLIFWKP